MIRMNKKEEYNIRNWGKKHELTSELLCQQLLERLAQSQRMRMWVQGKVERIIAYQPELTSLYLWELPAVDLLEHKIPIISDEFLDHVSIDEETKRILSGLQEESSESMMSCHFFLNYILERTQLRNLVDWLVPDIYLTPEEERSIASKIIIGKRPIDIREYANMNRDIKPMSVIKDVFMPPSGWFLSGSTFTPVNKQLEGIVPYYYDELIVRDKDEYIVWIFCTKSLESREKLCGRLYNEWFEYPESWKYLSYIMHHPQSLNPQ